MKFARGLIASLIIASAMVGVTACRQASQPSDDGFRLEHVVASLSDVRQSWPTKDRWEANAHVVGGDRVIKITVEPDPGDLRLADGDCVGFMAPNNTDHINFPQESYVGHVDTEECR